MISKSSFAIPGYLGNIHTVKCVSRNSAKAKLKHAAKLRNQYYPGVLFKKKIKKLTLDYFALLRLMFAHVERPARNNTEDTSEVPTGVSMATTGPGTTTVKKEKTDSPPSSPPPQTEVTSTPRPCPFSFPSMARLGYLSQNQAYVTAGTSRRRLTARPQCSICSKTFSRSGTLKVIIGFFNKHF